MSRLSDEMPDAGKIPYVAVSAQWRAGMAEVLHRQAALKRERRAFFLICLWLGIALLGISFLLVEVAVVQHSVPSYSSYRLTMLGTPGKPVAPLLAAVNFAIHIILLCSPLTFLLSLIVWVRAMTVRRRAKRPRLSPQP